jgi:hypothetical protein
MKTMRTASAALALAQVATAMSLLLTGCDRGDAGTPARDHGAAASSETRTAHPPAPLLDGKPIWADNREHTAMENLDFQFDHWGAALGARDRQDYARKARAFIDHPPHVVERVSRPNGDVLVYDKAANLFAIVRRDGAPRLFRKPPGGLADWERAKSEAASGGRSRGRARMSGGSDYARGEGD